MTPYYADEHVTIYCGDCRVWMVEHLIEVSGSIALITDPPYGIINQFGVMEGNGKRTLQFGWDEPEITETVLAVVGGLSVVADSAFVFCGADQFGKLIDSMRCEMTVKPAVWCKECPPPPGKGNWWPSAFELAIYGYRSGAFFGDDDPKRCNVFWYDSYRYGQPGKLDHPTQKPLALVRRIVNALAPPEGIALDPFMGSGTTLRAAKDLGRKAIGIEISERYCEIAAERMRQKVLF